MLEWFGLPLVDEYRGWDLKNISLNHALVIAKTTFKDIGVYSVSDDCYNCPFELLKHLKAGEETSFQVDSSSLLTWRIINSADYKYYARDYLRGLQCDMRPAIGEFGVYSLDVGRCDLKPEVPAVNSYLPLLLCTIFLLFPCFVYALVRLIKKRRAELKEIKCIECKEDEAAMQEPNDMIEVETGLQSLDFYRGILISLLIFITTGAGGYPVFNKSWGGITLGDTLYFVYVWTMGVKIPTVLEKAMRSGQRKCSIFWDILKRSFILYLLGTMIDSTVKDNTKESIALWCPLQRMSVAYFVAASCYLFTVSKFHIKSKLTILKAFGNIMSLLWCWIISGFMYGILVMLISTFVSFNCLANEKEHLQDRIVGGSDNSTEVLQTCNNGFSQFANEIFVNENKNILYIDYYIGFSRGVMGYLTTLLYAMSGLKTGTIYVHHESNYERMSLWSFWSTVFGVAGLVFAFVSYPMEFNLRSISSILLTSMVSMYFHVFIYYLVNMSRVKNSIITASGITSAAVLCGHLLFATSLPFHWQMELNNHMLYLMQNVWTIFLWIVVSVILAAKKIHFAI